MIGVSDTFVRLSNHIDFIQNNGSYFLYIFEGNVPTKAEIKTIHEMDAGKELHIDNILTFASNKGNKLLHARVFGDFKPSYPTHKLVQFSLSDKTEEFFQINEGTIGWFMFAKTANPSTSFNVSNIGNPAQVDAKCLVTMFGNCGDEDSDADLAILTGKVDTDREYAMTDLELSYL